MCDHRIDQLRRPWKDILEQYLQGFMAFFFSEANAAIDWDGYTFLDKELQQIVREAEVGRWLVGKLVQMWQLDGTEAWVYVSRFSCKRNL